MGELHACSHADVQSSAMQMRAGAAKRLTSASARNLDILNFSMSLENKRMLVQSQF
jgi:hypothetical protein